MSVSGKFAQVPIEAIMDARLTPTQFKVLVAIISFKNAKTGQLNPSRKLISDRCGIRETRISETTKELEALGWIKKEGKGGFSKSCHYEITIPNFGTVHSETTVPESGTVDDAQTVPKSGTVKPNKTVPESGTTTVPKSGTGGVPKSGTRKEHRIEHRKEHINPPISPATENEPKKSRRKSPIIDAKNIPLPRFMLSHKILWDAWIDTRYVKKVPDTASAISLSIDRLQRLMGEGYPPDQVLKIAVERVWAGLEHAENELKKQLKQTNNSFKKENYHDRRAATAKAILTPSANSSFDRGEIYDGAFTVSVD